MERVLSHIRWIAPAMGLGLLVTGCTKPTERLNAPPQGHTCYPNKMQETYTPMTDNAMLADMSMSEVHFVPHTSELSGTGVRRLDRYASLLSMYGGELRYDGAEETTLADARMERIKQFLLAAGIAPDKFSISRGFAGGAGMAGTEAVNARKGSEYKPSCTAGDSSIMSAATGGQ